MIQPKYIKIPDFSNFLGKDFIFTEDFKPSDIYYIFCKGMKFRVKKIHNNEITLKIISSISECEPAIVDFNNKLIKGLEQEIKIFDRILGLWATEPHKFVLSKASPWNAPEENNPKGGHCINTGYFSIPADHPDKYGMASSGWRKGMKDDSIMTMDYRRIDGLKNFYSFQSGENIWWSSECYKYMRAGKSTELEERRAFPLSVKKDLFGIIKGNYETTINKLNKGKFKAWESGLIPR